MSLTAEDVYNTEFANAAIGRRGYAKDEVDAFVRRIAKTLENADDLTAAEVHHVMFNKPLLGKRGYDEREVDEFLEEAEDTLAARTGYAANPLPSARTGTEPFTPGSPGTPGTPGTEADKRHHSTTG